MKCLSSRIGYWQAEELILAEDEKAQPPLLKRLEALKELERLMDGPCEKIPEGILRTMLAQRYGIKPEMVTWAEIWLEVDTLPSGTAVEVVPTDPATNKDQKRFLYSLPAWMLEEIDNHLSALLESDPSATNASSPPNELGAPAPTPHTAQSESHRAETAMCADAPGKAEPPPNELPLASAESELNIDQVPTETELPIQGKQVGNPGGRPREMLDIDGEQVKQLCGDTPHRVFARMGKMSVDNLRRACGGHATQKTIEKICLAARCKGLKIKPRDLKKK